MAIKIGINGFGRIARVALRLIYAQPERFELCGVNLRKAELDHMVYMTKYDSVMGRFPYPIEEGDGCLIISGKPVKVYSESDINNIDWGLCGAEYIIESTGAFNTTEKALIHVRNGAKKVIFSAPAKDDITPTFVMGVNHESYLPEYKVVSNASCTTNCLAPLAKVVNDAFGIEKALMSTIHAATAKQKAVDSRAGRDWRTGRSVFNNIIPSSTGAAKAVGLVIPSLQGKMTGMSFRIPANNVSVVDLTAVLKTPTDYKSICKAVKDASLGYMDGIVDYCEDDVVSSDLKGDPHTCIFDVHAGIMLDSNFVKLLAWYDNEYGYTCKLLDLTEHMYKIDNQ